jgi:hypothetical protein
MDRWLLLVATVRHVGNQLGEHCGLDEPEVALGASAALV